MSLRKAKAAKAENHERWLITYADLITLLLVFFIVLYAGSQEDSHKFAILAQGLRSAFNNPSNSGGGGQSAVFLGSGSTNQGGYSQQEIDFKAIQTMLQQITAQQGLNGAVHVQDAQNEIDIDLTSDLLFPSGGADLRPEAKPALDAVAQSLQGKPNQIRIEGHTDNIPINTVQFNSNWELSAARATAVLRYLVEIDGLPSQQLYAAAYGDTHPVADNSTPDGRAQNRRAEIVVLYPPQSAAGAASPSVTPVPSATPAAAR
jgi:chemotaxis protein MotB